MQAITVRERDAGVAGLSVEDIPCPRTAENDVLVRVHAAGFTTGELDWPGTCNDRAGRDRTPSVPGHDVSGVVVELGYGTTGLTVGQLTPPERVAFVLHDVFGFEFGRIAEVLDVSVPGSRQLASRARRRVAQAKQSTPDAPKEERERLLATFRAAYESGDLTDLVRLLHPDAVYITDGGGKVTAARKILRGAERMADVMVRVGRMWRPDHIGFIEVGGELALMCHWQGRVYSVDTVQITDGLITAYRRVINPDKLSHV
ncbi:sigma factor-like helix-turn-helix DNA-binding protein [Amycolatopsis sp. DSM 110486]|uniref:sigma factor-like helix-turn-helix DNA-binding protein n=1 Tax=Amycolatopsis sp. DSM 110486 TaxID=2865832 RepID=UPI001C6A85B5|nr:sigma factor-like helix-turn-helix DNA-binding protein [Amycolatopsis sp. DSM 110486]QYN20561.1 alcohol dehydrogenase catalytic domain-containing protein [Amycolatopsis sp. DSM 110486]